MSGRHTVFGFYRQLAKPFNQGKKKLGIICVLSAKSLYGPNYDQWTWVKCARFIANNNTNLLFRLDKTNYGEANVMTLVSNNKKKRLIASGPANVHFIGSSTDTPVPLSIDVTMNKYSMKLFKCDVFCWIFGYGTPFGKTLSPAFCRIYKPISGYTSLCSQTFNTIFDEDYPSIAIFLEPIFFNMKTVTSAWNLSMFIMICITKLMEKLSWCLLQFYPWLISAYSNK